MTLLPSTPSQSEERIIIRPPKPHSIKQKLIMEFFLHEGLEEIYIACGTKFGKSVGAGVGISAGVLSRPGTRWRWVAPIYLQSQVGYDYCSKLLPPEPYTKPNNSDLKLVLVNPKNPKDLSHYIQFFHAQSPTSLEGHAIHGYVFDEAAKIKEDAYSAAKTTRTVTRGPMMFLSTPFGKNWFYKKCMEAKEEMLRAHREGRRPKKMFIRATTADNPFVPRESIEEARTSMPARLFRQYYLAEFMDDGNVFSGFRECFYTPRIAIHEAVQRWIHPEAKTRRVVIGADWAKTTDWTVFIAVDIDRRQVVGFLRFHKEKYTTAIKELVRFSREFGELEMVWHDRTGVGEAIDDQLEYTSLPFEGIVFSASSKSDMVNSLITSIERKDIILPNWDVLESEMDAYEVTTNALGRMSYSAPIGQHDDVVSALMLANACLEQFGDHPMEVKFLEDLKADTALATVEKGSLEAYYRELLNDED